MRECICLSTSRLVDEGDAVRPKMFHSLQMHARFTSSPQLFIYRLPHHRRALPPIELIIPPAQHQLLTIHHFLRVYLPGEFSYPSKKTTLACVSTRSYDIGAVTVAHLPRNQNGWYLLALRTAATSVRSRHSICCHLCPVSLHGFPML